MEHKQESGLDYFIRALQHSEFIPSESEVLNQLIEKCRAMHKQEIVVAYSNGALDAIKRYREIDCYKYYLDKYGK